MSAAVELGEASASGPTPTPTLDLPSHDKTQAGPVAAPATLL